MKRLIFSLYALGVLCLFPYSETGEAGEDSKKGNSLTIIQPTEKGLAIIETEEQPSKKTKKEKPTPEVTVPGKARIVVVPAVYLQETRSKFERELFERFDLSDPSALEDVEFSRHLVDALVNCRKFDVLERETLRDVIKEIDFGESDYADLSRTVRMGKMLNADYVLLPEIRFILIIEESKKVPYVPITRTTYEATMGMNIRVVDVRTSRLASSSIDETTYTEKLKRKEKDKIKQGLMFIDNLFARAAAKEISKVIDVVYPIKIVSFGTETVTLNRGKGAIEPGEILDVYKPGEIMLDPDTGENLGYSEECVGKIEVIEVKAKVSIAKVLEGMDKIGKYYICRRGREIETPEEKNPAPRID